MLPWSQDDQKDSSTQIAHIPMPHPILLMNT